MQRSYERCQSTQPGVHGAFTPAHRGQGSYVSTQHYVYNCVWKTHRQSFQTIPTCLLPTSKYLETARPASQETTARFTYQVEQYCIHTAKSAGTETCPMCSWSWLWLALHVHQQPVEISGEYDFATHPIWRAHTTDQLINCIGLRCYTIHQSFNSSSWEDRGDWPWCKISKATLLEAVQKRLCDIES